MIPHFFAMQKAVQLKTLCRLTEISHSPLIFHLAHSPHTHINSLQIQKLNYTLGETYSGQLTYPPHIFGMWEEGGASGGNREINAITETPQKLPSQRSVSKLNCWYCKSIAPLAATTVPFPRVGGDPFNAVVTSTRCSAVLLKIRA